jgi:hypothetical protein
MYKKTALDAYLKYKSSFINTKKLNNCYSLSGNRGQFEQKHVFDKMLSQ